jgi:pimeloyl-ACP methyl ester carboxylesterase
MTSSIPAHSGKQPHERVHDFSIPSPRAGLSLHLTYLPPASDVPPVGRVVLYVHGATFPGTLALGHQFEGVSWRDELRASGFHTWTIDFHGFGASDSYPEMREPGEAHPPLGGVADAVPQLEAAGRFICARHGIARLSPLAHSWGTIPAARFAGLFPELLERLVLFAPVVRRAGGPPPTALPAWHSITREEQWQRFVRDTPLGEPSVLAREHFDAWAEAFLALDSGSRTRTPAAVRTPSGPLRDIAAAWSGEALYDPEAVRAPVLIVRGAWDSMCTDGDARTLFDGLRNAAQRRDVKIARAGHLMHLEEQRRTLYRETETFLYGNDIAPPRAARTPDAPCSQ